MTVVKSRLKVAGKDAKSSRHALDTLPVAIREFATGLPNLLEHYYEWTDLPGNFGYESKRLIEYLNVNKTSDDVLTYIKEVYMRSFPIKSESDIRFLMQFAKSFYSQRGTEESLKFLFKALYNDSVEVDYPSRYIFTTSDGYWSKPTYIRILNVDGLEDARGTRIWGYNSKASAILDDYTIFAANEDIIAECTISEVVGTFHIDEPITINTGGDDFYSRTYPTVAVISIDNPGLGYKEGSLLKLSEPGDGIGFYAKIASTGTLGEILQVDVISAGTGYIYAAPVLDLDDPDIFDETLSDHETASITVGLVTNNTSPGSYTSKKSLLSDIYVLHDGDYYQNFSYVIKTNVPVSTFRDVVKSLAHPAGTKMFTLSSNDLNPGDIINNDGSWLYHLSHPEDVNYRNTDALSSRKFFDVDVYINSVKYDIGVASNPLRYPHNIHIHKQTKSLTDLYADTYTRISIYKEVSRDTLSISPAVVLINTIKDSSPHAYEYYNIPLVDIELTRLKNISTGKFATKIAFSDVVLES